MVLSRVYSRSIEKENVMQYTIGELSKLSGVGIHTLRYYEKEGLLYEIQRDENKKRVYREHDLDVLNSITCLKETGMSIADIKEYITLCKEGLDTLDTRIELFKKQREQIAKQMLRLEKYLETANYKIWYYENIAQLGDESQPDNCAKMKAIYEQQKKSKN